MHKKNVGYSFISLSFSALFLGVYLTNSVDSDYNKTECVYTHAGEAASASAWIL